MCLQVHGFVVFHFWKSTVSKASAYLRSSMHEIAPGVFVQTEEPTWNSVFSFFLPVFNIKWNFNQIFSIPAKLSIISRFYTSRHRLFWWSVKQKIIIIWRKNMRFCLLDLSLNLVVCKIYIYIYVFVLINILISFKYKGWYFTDAH